MAADGAELVFEDSDFDFDLDVGFAGVEEFDFADDPLNLLSITPPVAIVAARPITPVGRPSARCELTQSAYKEESIFPGERPQPFCSVDALPTPVSPSNVSFSANGAASGYVLATPTVTAAAVPVIARAVHAVQANAVARVGTVLPIGRAVSIARPIKRNATDAGHAIVNGTPAKKHWQHSSAVSSPVKASPRPVMQVIQTNKSLPVTAAKQFTSERDYIMFQLQQLKYKESRIIEHMRLTGQTGASPPMQDMQYPLDVFAN